MITFDTEKIGHYLLFKSYSLYDLDVFYKITKEEIGHYAKGFLVQEENTKVLYNIKSGTYKISKNIKETDNCIGCSEEITNDGYCEDCIDFIRLYIVYDHLLENKKDTFVRSAFDQLLRESGRVIKFNSIDFKDLGLRNFRFRKKQNKIKYSNILNEASEILKDFERFRRSKSFISMISISDLLKIFEDNQDLRNRYDDYIAIRQNMERLIYFLEKLNKFLNHKSHY